MFGNKIQVPLQFTSVLKCCPIYRTTRTPVRVRRNVENCITHHHHAQHSINIQLTTSSPASPPFNLSHIKNHIYSYHLLYLIFLLLYPIIYHIALHLYTIHYLSLYYNIYHPCVMFTILYHLVFIIISHIYSIYI